METLRQAIGQRDALLLTIPETTRLDYELVHACSSTFQYSTLSTKTQSNLLIKTY